MPSTTDEGVWRRARRGSATVELALVAPILVVLVLWGNYFWELQRARLKAAELARYVAFERTVRTDVDRIAVEARTRYRDLDGSTKDGELGTAYRNRLTLNVRASNVDAPLTSERLADRGALAGATGLAGAAIGALAGQAGDAEQVALTMGLDASRGAVLAQVDIKIQNAIIPEHLALYTTGFNNDLLNPRFTETFRLYHDTWRAWGPGDQPSNSYPRVEARTRERVRRIVYAGGAGEAGGVQGAIDGVLSTLRLDSPFSDAYINGSVMIREVDKPGNFYRADGLETRTVPGDALQARYWVNDDIGCYGTCEPTRILHKRGLRHGGGWDDNWPMRAYNCRGPYFQGAIQSQAPESEYSKEGFTGHGDYHSYVNGACAE